MNAHKRIGALLVLMLVAGICTATAQNNGCGITWLDTTRLSYDAVPSNVPRFVVSGDTIHTLWFGLDTLGTVSDDGIQYARSTDGGLSFNTQFKIASGDTALDAGSIVLSKNFIYVTFFAFIDTFYGTALCRSSDAGTTWQPVQYLLKSTLPRLIVAQDNDVIIHYFNQVTNKFGILRSTNNGNSWSVANPNVPSLSQIVAAPGVLYAVAEVDNSIRKEIGFYFSLTKGSGWYGPEIISPEDVTSSILPAIAVNEPGDLFVTWNDTGGIFLRRSFYDEEEGLLWHPPQYLSESEGAVFSDIAASGDFVSVVWDNESGGIGGIRLRSSNDVASSFCPIQLPTMSSAAGAPKIAINGERIHLMWSDRVGAESEVLFQTGMLLKNTLPLTFAMDQNYPNPFNGTTAISYHIPTASIVTLTVYNVLGQRVATLVNDYQLPQQYTVTFPADNLPSGVYFYRLATSTFSTTKKMVLVK